MLRACLVAVSSVLFPGAFKFGKVVERNKGVPILRLQFFFVSLLVRKSVLFCLVFTFDSFRVFRCGLNENQNAQTLTEGVWCLKCVAGEALVGLFLRFLSTFFLDVPV